MVAKHGIWIQINPSGLICHTQLICYSYSLELVD